MSKAALGATLLLISICSACGGGSMSVNTNPPPPTRVVNANVAVDNITAGSFDVALSTSFQPAEWDYTFFQSSLAAKATLLGNLQPKHIRLQGISQGVPQITPTSWDFTILDSITQPVLTVGDHSPEFQIAKAPPYMYANNDSSQSFTDLTFTQFAAYAKNLVEYYNTRGFTSSGVHFASPSGTHITWWGIYNEPSINNNLDATDYTTMYNAVVPAMQSADPNLKYVALELCCGSENWTQTFAANVTAKVDVVAAHYYSSCNQRDTDHQVFNTVPGFATSVQTIYNDLSVSASLSSIPVWITENNVNADFDKGGGISACNNTTFVADKRGSSAFFAAWRPYVFSQIGKAGAKALYHWDFDADAQFGEVDYNTGQPQLSYWVDYWLARMFPSGSGEQLLQTTNSDGSEIEVLPIMNTDGSVVILVANHAVASATDNNGDGLTADIAMDVSALGSFTSASEMLIDSSTNPSTGPTPQTISATSPIKLSLNGYGVAIVKLQ